MEEITLQILTQEIEVVLNDFNLPQEKEVIGIDIETTGLNPYTSKIRLIQLYFPSANKVYVLDMFEADKHEWSIVKTLLKSNKFVAHNAIFELAHLRHNFKLDDINIGCSLMLYSLVTSATQVVTLSTKLSLEAAVRERLGYEVDKTYQKSDWSGELSVEQLNYAAEDAVLTRWLVNLCAEDFKKHSLNNIYQLNKAAMKPVVDMYLNGIYVDKGRHRVLMEEWRRAKTKAYAELRRLIPPKYNLNSPKDMTQYLTETLPAATLKNWPISEKSGYLKTDKQTYKNHDKLPFVKHILEYSKFQKAFTTYGNGLFNEILLETNRIHPSYTLCQTDTGRMSSRAPNIQNQPRGELRDIYAAEEGSKLVVADFSQIELRVAAIISKDEKMLSVYENQEDLYIQTAAALNDIPPESVTDEERRKAKAIILGLQFGMGVNKLLTYCKDNYQVDLTYKEGKEFVDKYRKLYSGLRKWQKRQAEQCEHTLECYTRGGRKRKLSPDRFFTTGVNTPVQGSAAEVMLHSLIKVSQQIQYTDIRLIFCVHDEIGLECPEKDVDKAKEILENSMKEGMLEVFPEAESMIEGLVEASVGKTWGECK